MIGTSALWSMDLVSCTPRLCGDSINAPQERLYRTRRSSIVHNALHTLPSPYGAPSSIASCPSSLPQSVSTFGEYRAYRLCKRQRQRDEARACGKLSCGCLTNAWYSLWAHDTLSPSVSLSGQRHRCRRRLPDDICGASRLVASGPRCSHLEGQPEPP